MPHIGSELPDEAGLALIADWINGMNGRAESADANGDFAPPDQALASATAAQRLARKLARGELSAAERGALMAAAAKLPSGPIRDLFEGYLPSDEKRGRTLGSNPRPGAVLSLTGDRARGEKLFWSQPVQCGNCHSVAGRGTAVGPDLSTIGKLRSREDLLVSLIEPSRRIEPKYATYVVATTDGGAALTGVLVKRDERSIVLRDAQNKEINLAAQDVEELRPTRTSLMPDGQLAHMTAQEAADLIEYLSTLK
jgi:putative heme-binding domain-containing protein